MLGSQSTLLSEPLAADLHLPSGTERLSVIPADHSRLTHTAIDSLRQDQVVLIQDITVSEIDEVVRSVSEAFGLRQSLEMQAAYAGILRNRRNITKYFMTVNERRRHQFIKPHSEGSWFVNIQLAAFYCASNSTDGGETFLFNVESKRPDWRNLKEMVPKMLPSERLMSASDIALAKVLLKIDPDHMMLCADDVVVRELDPVIEGVKFVQVLAALRPRLSRILSREVYTLWDSVSGADLTSTEDFFRLLQQSGLIKLPDPPVASRALEAAGFRAIWESNIHLGQLFQHVLARKLAPRELVIFNNLTWAHACNNWTPGSGIREVFAAFA